MTAKWLHLSDWHHNSDAPDFDRNVMLKALLDDIEQRSKISLSLEKIDFCIFSGDISYNGSEKQYIDAERTIISQIKNRIGDIPIIFCPGNHDLDRSLIEDIPGHLENIATGTYAYSNRLESIISAGDKTSYFTKQFTKYIQFCERLGQRYIEGNLHYSRILEIGGKKIGICSINSTWLSARKKFPKRSGGQISDYGFLRVSEAQIRKAHSEILDADLKIIFMHHPLNWLCEDEQVRIGMFIRKYFDIFMHGHEHRPDINNIIGGARSLLHLSAGASYNRRISNDPRYSSAYNYIELDIDSRKGQSHHRVWSEVNDEWVEDSRYWSNGRSSFTLTDKSTSIQKRESLLFDVGSYYADFLKKRLVTHANVSIRQTKVAKESKTNVEMNISYNLKCEDGPKETFPISITLPLSYLDKNNTQLRTEMFSLIECSGQYEQTVTINQDDDQVKISFLIQVPGKDAEIRFHYKFTDDISGKWKFSLGRFYKAIEIHITEDRDLNYDYIDFGGLPNFEMKKHSVHDYKEYSDRQNIHFPQQGFLMLWSEK